MEALHGAPITHTPNSARFASFDELLPVFEIHSLRQEEQLLIPLSKNRMDFCCCLSVRHILMIQYVFMSQLS